MCPGITLMRAYSRTTRSNAKHFFDYLSGQFPSRLISIQVDGGSEFRNELMRRWAYLYLSYHRESLNTMAVLSGQTARCEFYPFY